LLYIPGISKELIKIEEEAIQKVCKKPHQNIIAVLHLGELASSQHYFIDMELCDLNLHQFIDRTNPPNPSESIPYFIKDATPPLRARQIWNVMKQIASGTKYLHGLRIVHRDLKPANSMLFSFVLAKHLYSSLFEKGCFVEVGGLRVRVRRQLKHTSHFV
jgi:serine/threonine protein kinase